MLLSVMFLSRAWSPGKNSKVVFEVKYDTAFCAYSESVAHLIESGGQDEHEEILGVTQYTLLAQQ